MLTPLARVRMALNGPAAAGPGLGSKVSTWLGPPFIQSTMHAVALAAEGGAAPSASAARGSSHEAASAPKRPPPRVPRKRRRSLSSRFMVAPDQWLRANSLEL